MLFSDAISRNLNFPKPRRDEFEDAMIKALKSTKERFRRQQKRPRYLDENDEPKEPMIQRRSINKRQKDDTRNNSMQEMINSDDAQQQIDQDQEKVDQECILNLSDTEQSLDYNPAIDYNYINDLSD